MKNKSNKKTLQRQAALNGDARKLPSLLLALLVISAFPSLASAATPNDARGFVDTIGVNTHLFYTDTVYNNYPLVKQRLGDLGVRHIRDSFDPDHRQFFYDRVNDLSAAGVKSTLLSCRLAPGRPFSLDADISDAKNKIRNALEGIEGSNEPDIAGYADWANQTRDCQYWLNRLARSTTYGAALTAPIYEPSVTGDRYGKLGVMSDRADGGNMHPYPGQQKPSGPDYYSFARAMSESRQFGFGGKAVPVIASETGYHTAINSTGNHRPVSETAQAIYTPRLFLEYAKAGVQRTFNYEMFDLRADPARSNDQDNFGLLHNDGSFKPAGTALKNTIGFLDSPAKSAQKPLGVTLSNTADPDGTGRGGAVKNMLFQKADGSYWLALWQDSEAFWNGVNYANPSVIVGVTLDRALAVTGYRPTYGTGSVGALSTRTSFRVGVGDDVILLKLS